MSNLVVEVKGKRAKNKRGRRDWENWVTTDDLDGLVRWQAMFGPGFRAVLAFAYAEPIQPFPLPGDNGAYEFRGLDYRFWAVGLDDYIAHLRSRGPAWKAVAMARRAFRRRVRPLLEWLPMSYDWSRRPHSRQGTPTMIKPRKRFKRWIAPVLLGLGLSLTPAFSPPARAQEETADAKAKRAARSTATWRPSRSCCWPFSSWVSPPGGDRWPVA